jgi:hypothetical protein
MAIFFFKISKIPLLDSPAPFFFGRQVKKIRQKKEKNTATHSPIQ